MDEDWTQVWRPAEVVGGRDVARGTRMVTLRLPDDLPFPFLPGHVVALRDLGFRHAYTVCRAHPGDRLLDLVFRVIPGGRLTPHLASAPPGHVVEVSGLHHRPVEEEVCPAAEAVVGLSTGSGVGPLWGFAERALARGFARPITLVTGFREEADIGLGPELEALQARHGGFRWHPALTRPSAGWRGAAGRVGEVAPARVGDPRSSHFHLVGNGRMVADLKAVLRAVGVPAEQVSAETFFNHNAEADPGAVEALIRLWS